MVSSGQVTSDLNSILSSLSSYNTSIQSLDGNWQGDSHTNLVSKAEEFLGEYKSTIEGEMSAFANACDLYVEYIETKRKIAELQSLNSSKEDKKTDYTQEIANLEEKLVKLKQEIESALQSASSGSLSASGTNTDVSTDAVTVSTINQGELTDEQVQKLMEIAKSQIGVPYNSMNYGPKEDGSKGFGCAMFVSYVYNNLLFGGVSGQNDTSSGFYGSCKNYWGNATNDNFNAHNKGFVEVSLKDAKPGDVICFVDTDGKGTGHDSASSCYHVGIYEGDGKMIHSSTTTNGVGEIDIDKYLKKRGRGNEYYILHYVGNKETSNKAVQV